jgi:phosphoglycerate dehydrogenase-like enzyme
LEELLVESDIVSLHCPLNDDTRGLIGEKELGLMKETGIILNTARGGLVRHFFSVNFLSDPRKTDLPTLPQIDELALIRALSEHKIFGAGLDVLSHEPPTRAQYPELLALENVVVFPHIGAQEETSQRNACLVAVETAYSYLIGKGLGESKRVI